MVMKFWMLRLKMTSKKLLPGEKYKCVKDEQEEESVKPRQRVWGLFFRMPSRCGDSAVYFFLID